MPENEPFAIEADELDHILEVLEEHANNENETGFERVLELLAEQPREILARNPLIGESEVEYARSLRKDYIFLRDYGSATMTDSRGFGRLALNTLERAAAVLLAEISAFRGWPGCWLPGMWSKDGHRMKLALLRFLNPNVSESVYEDLEREIRLARYGQKFRKASQGPRMDALNKVLWKILNESVRCGKLPTARVVWNQLSTGDTIQEVDNEDGMIYWRRSDGREEKTKHKSFVNRLTALRKKLASKKPRK